MRLLYLSIDRHPEEIKLLIRHEISKRFNKVIETTYEAPDSEIIDKISNCDAVLMAPGRFLKNEIHEAGKQVRIFQLWSSGFDKINYTKIRELNQIVATNGGANKFSVAEHTIMLLLASSRRLPEMHHRVISGQWEGNGHGVNLHTLRGKTIGIVGLGAIGHQVARLCDAFGMTIHYFDIVGKSDTPKHWKLQTSLMSLVASSDFVSLHIHHTPGAEPILDKEVLQGMKKGSVLVNTAREELVDLETLQELINGNQISSYAADVFEIEPTLGSEKILRLPNTVFTPHIAGSNMETYQLAISNCLENIERVKNGQEPKWRVL